MSSRKQNQAAWEEVRKQVVAHPDPGGLRYPRGRLPHPRDAGARPTATWPVGQVADFSIPGPTGQPPLVVREFPDSWQAFLDTAQLTGQVLGAVERAPGMAMFVGAALVGGAIGSSASNKREGMLLGAGVGLLLAAVIQAAMAGDQQR